MGIQDKPSIVALGDLALDVFVAEQAGVVPGSDTRGVVRLHPGGSAANLAVWAARLGARSTFIGSVGEDYAGEFLRQDLRREGVEAHLLRCAHPTAAIAVLVDDLGERSMIADRGAAVQLHAGFLAASMFPPASHLHLPAYSLFEEPLAGAAMLAADLCRGSGGRVTVDTSSVGPLRAYGRERFLALLDRLGPDLLFANDAEATFLSGSDDAVVGSAVLLRYARTVVWKLGARGAVARADALVRGTGLAVPAVDTTGAGDAFAAAFTVAAARGRSLPDALCAANRLAAAVVQQVGARPAIPAEILSSLNSSGLISPSAGSSTPA